MELEQHRPGNLAMTFDEVSMERSKSFVKALQELKNLRPQLYSAAEYCEKFYLHSKQKQMVLDNLKDYVVRALVNAVDHLGTVAYKLTDLLDQQTSDVSTVDLKVTCLNQKLLTCQTYMDKEGSRQHQLLAFIPRHHKHYILPNSMNKKVHFSPHVQTDTRQHPYQARAHLHIGDTKISVNTAGVFQLVENEEGSASKSLATQLQQPSGLPTSGGVKQTLGPGHREAVDGSKLMTAFRSFENPRRDTMRVPVRSKSVLSAFFAKQKSNKLQAGSDIKVTLILLHLHHQGQTLHGC
ncbi:unnamed protein product [Malus baccata var. baccata]